jgi:ABC-type uncharacterized transport system substrate-binding protein
MPRTAVQQPILRSLVAALLVLIGPVVAEAQPARKIYRIGVLDVVALASNAENLGSFRQGLKELGYVEEQDFRIEYRSADGQAGRFPDLASELVRLKVDVIVTRGTPAALPSRQRERSRSSWRRAATPSVPALWPAWPIRARTSPV